MIVDVAGLILEAVDRHGLLLVHDRSLPSVTALITGGPVAGSWWAHPMSNSIYNALVEIEDDVADVRLLRGKVTLVAPRLWADLVAVGSARARWQTDSLPGGALDLLAAVEASSVPFVVNRHQRGLARRLEQRLLVKASEIHTETGHHVKAYQGWLRWAARRRVSPTSDLSSAREALQAAATTSSPDAARLLPW